MVLTRRGAARRGAGDPGQQRIAADAAAQIVVRQHQAKLRHAGAVSTPAKSTLPGRPRRLRV